MRSTEYCKSQIAFFKYRFSYIRFREIGSLEIALTEPGLAELHLVEYRMPEEAILEVHREKEWIATINSKTKKLAILEFHIIESGSLQFHETQITSLESALPECGMRQILLSEYAVREYAIIILPRVPCTLGKIDLLELLILSGKYHNGKSELFPSCLHRLEYTLHRDDICASTEHDVVFLRTSEHTSKCHLHLELELLLDFLQRPEIIGIVLHLLKV